MLLKHNDLWNVLVAIIKEHDEGVIQYTVFNSKSQENQTQGIQKQTKTGKHVKIITGNSEN